MSLSPKEFDNTYENKWCPGCGNFGILKAMKSAFAKLEILPENLILISGIGQAAKTPEFLNCNYFHGLHGRALPVATGVLAAHHKAAVIVNSGDGDCYGEGGNHFMHAIRRNVNLTLLVHDNRVYGLTKGQASPTTDPGTKTSMQPEGAFSTPFNPLLTALSLGAGFVARGFSGNGEQLADLVARAVAHKGFSLVDILQPCVSFNKVNTFSWFKERVRDLEETGHDPSDFQAALSLCLDQGDKIPTGLFYQKPGPCFPDNLAALSKGVLRDQNRNEEKVKEIISGYQHGF